MANAGGIEVTFRRSRDPRRLPIPCISAILVLLAVHVWNLARAQSSVPSLTRRFVDVTRSSGIDFHLTAGSPEKKYIFESLEGGVAVFDYDRDGGTGTGSGCAGHLELPFGLGSNGVGKGCGYDAG